MGGLDLVVSQLDRALEAINYQDVELPAMAAADDSRIDGRYVEVHQGVLSLLGRQALFLDDLRLASGFAAQHPLHRAHGRPVRGIWPSSCRFRVTKHPRTPTILEWIEKMGITVRQEILQARDAFHTRHVSLARDLVRPGQGRSQPPLKMSRFRRLTSSAAQGLARARRGA